MASCHLCISGMLGWSKGWCSLQHKTDHHPRVANGCCTQLSRSYCAAQNSLSTKSLQHTSSPTPPSPDSSPIQYRWLSRHIWVAFSAGWKFWNCFCFAGFEMEPFFLVSLLYLFAICTLIPPSLFLQLNCNKMNVYRLIIFSPLRSGSKCFQLWEKWQKGGEMKGWTFVPRQLFKCWGSFQKLQRCIFFFCLFFFQNRRWFGKFRPQPCKHVGTCLTLLLGEISSWE